MTHLLTVSNRKVDVTPWIEQIKENVAKGHGIFDRTPICIKQDKTYFWYIDIGKFKDLNTKSVKQLIKFYTK